MLLGDVRMVGGPVKWAGQVCIGVCGCAAPHQPPAHVCVDLAGLHVSHAWPWLKAPHLGAEGEGAFQSLAAC